MLDPKRRNEEAVQNILGLQSELHWRVHREMQLRGHSTVGIGERPTELVRFRDDHVFFGNVWGSSHIQVTPDTLDEKCNQDECGQNGPRKLE